MTENIHIEPASVLADVVKKSFDDTYGSKYALEAILEGIKTVSLKGSFFTGEMSISKSLFPRKEVDLDILIKLLNDYGYAVSYYNHSLHYSVYVNICPGTKEDWKKLSYIKRLYYILSNKKYLYYLFNY